MTDDGYDALKISTAVSKLRGGFMVSVENLEKKLWAFALNGSKKLAKSLNFIL